MLGYPRPSDILTGWTASPFLARSHSPLLSSSSSSPAPDAAQIDESEAALKDSAQADGQPGAEEYGGKPGEDGHDGHEPSPKESNGDPAPVFNDTGAFWEEMSSLRTRLEALEGLQQKSRAEEEAAREHDELASALDSSQLQLARVLMQVSESGRIALPVLTAITRLKRVVMDMVEAVYATEPNAQRQAIAIVDELRLLAECINDEPPHDGEHGAREGGTPLPQMRGLGFDLTDRGHWQPRSESRLSLASSSASGRLWQRRPPTRATDVTSNWTDSRTGVYGRATPSYKRPHAAAAASSPLATQVRSAEAVLMQRRRRQRHRPTIRDYDFTPTPGTAFAPRPDGDMRSPLLNSVITSPALSSVGAADFDVPYKSTEMERHPRRLPAQAARSFAVAAAAATPPARTAPSNLAGYLRASGRRPYTANDSGSSAEEEEEDEGGVAGHMA